MPETISLSSLRALYRQGRYLSAYKAGQQWGPLESWEGTDEQVLAGSLAMHLGASRLGRQLHRKAWRGNPTHWDAMCYRAFDLSDRFGPFRAWLSARKVPLPETPTTLEEAHWLALLGSFLAELRDFEQASQFQEKAEAIAPQDPWIMVDRANLLQRQDRYDEALEVARRSFAAQPWYRPAVEKCVSLLLLLDRAAEALELLQEACSRCEAPYLFWQKSFLLSDLDRQDEAFAALKDFRQMALLMEPELEKSWYAHASDICRLAGNKEAAIAYAEKAESEFFTRIARRLQTSTTIAPRRLLRLQFVRQHYMTCVPATLTVLARHWQKPIEHLAVAAEICYDGTPLHKEREWIEQQGFFAAEFSLTFPAAKALLDRGVPFALSTSGPTDAHMQAVVGYDESAGLLLIRDPNWHHVQEFDAEALIDQNRSTGPRCLALVPESCANLLCGIELPERDLYDHYFRLQQALLKFDRNKAQQICEEMHELQPDHRLVWRARLSIAAFDGDPVQRLACLDTLLAQFPDDVGLILDRLNTLREVTGRNEWFPWLESLLKRSAGNPYLVLEYGVALSRDHRRISRARKHLFRAVRDYPQSAALTALADLCWDHGERTESLSYYRLASCQADKDENKAMSYFIACQALGRREEGLAFLNDRVTTLGSRSSMPIRTLFDAYEQMERRSEANQALETALAVHPDDGALLLFAADKYGRQGNAARAEELLRQAHGRASPVACLRTAAGLAQYSGKLREARGLWQQVLGLEPLALDANRSTARLIAETEDVRAAQQFLADVASRFPSNPALLKLELEWLDHDDLTGRENCIRHLLDVDPQDAWAIRDLALVLKQQNRFEESLAQADLAIRIAPTNTQGFGVRGDILESANRLGEAREDYRRAISLCVDNDFAINRLIACSLLPEEKREHLRFVLDQLNSQVSFGDGMLAFADRARSVWKPDELLALLRQTHSARPDLWHSWSALIQQLVAADAADEAKNLALQATERFSLQPRLWLDLADAYKALGCRQDQIKALQKAHEVDPAWSLPIQQLSDAYRQSGDQAKSRSVLEQGRSRLPLDPYIHGFLADLLIAEGQKSEAVELLERAILLEPSYHWASNTLVDLATELGCIDPIIEFGRRLTQDRPNNPYAWLVLSRSLSSLPDLSQALEAADRSLAIETRSVDSCLWKARLLARREQCEEAIGVCRSPAFGAAVPPTLALEAALLERQSGKREKAYQSLRAMLQNQPNHYVGWTQLADWCREDQDWPGYLEASRGMAAVSPAESMSQGYLGDALARNEQNEAAIEAFEKVFTRDPSYSFAGNCLFDLYFEAGNNEDAEKALARLQHFNPGAYTLARAVQLAARQKAKGKAIAHFEDLCRTQEDNWVLLKMAADALERARCSRLCRKTLKRMLPTSPLNPDVGKLYFYCVGRRGGGLSGYRQLSRLDPKSVVWSRAAVAFMEKLREKIQTANQSLQLPLARPLLRVFLAREEQHWRMHTYCWGWVGYTLFSVGWSRLAKKYLADWETKTDVRPWMLYNLALAGWYTKDFEFAQRVSEKALQLAKDHTTSGHQLFVVIYLLLHNSTGAAGPRFERLSEEQFEKGWDQSLYQLTSLWIETVSTSARISEKEIRNRIGKIKRNVPKFKRDRFLGWLYRQWVWRYACTSSTSLLRRMYTFVQLYFAG